MILIHTAIGVDATILGLSFLKYAATNATLIVDPFCGYGTIVAAANYFKLNSFGIDLSLKRCKKAITRSLQEEIESVPITRRKLLGARGDEVAVFTPYRAKSRRIKAENDNVVIEVDKITINSTDEANETCTTALTHHTSSDGLIT